MWRSLKLAGSITVLVLMLSIHSVEAFSSKRLPDSPGEWAYLILLALDAALVVQEVRHHVLHFADLEHRASLAQGLAMLGWTMAFVLPAFSGAFFTNNDAVSAGIFCAAVAMVAATRWKASIDKRAFAEKRSSQIRRSGGIQLEMEIMERWNGKRRLVLP